MEVGPNAEVDKYLYLTQLWENIILYNTVETGNKNTVYKNIPVI